MISWKSRHLMSSDSLSTVWLSKSNLVFQIKGKKYTDSVWESSAGPKREEGEEPRNLYSSFDIVTSDEIKEDMIGGMCSMHESPW